jgi:hypothetical protein
VLNDRASITAFNAVRNTGIAMTKDGKNVRKKPSGLQLTGRESGQSLRHAVHRHHILTGELPSAQGGKVVRSEKKGSHPINCRHLQFKKLIFLPALFLKKDTCVCI